MPAPEPTAPIHDAHRAPFHQLDWPLFERLLVDLLQEEDGIAVSELHGLPGPQTDFGVDVIGIRVDGGSELVSCKRYGTITAGQLATWSRDALKQWPARWHSPTFGASSSRPARPTSPKSRSSIRSPRRWRGLRR